VAGQPPKVITEHAATQWDLELDDLFVAIGHRFGRVELRRRMRDYVPGLLAPVARKNSWQLAEHAGHRAPDGLQHLLAGAKWEPDHIRDELQEYVADKLGEDGRILIVDDTGFVKKGITSAGVQRQYSGTGGRTENCQIGVFTVLQQSAEAALLPVGGIRSDPDYGKRRGKGTQHHRSRQPSLGDELPINSGPWPPGSVRGPRPRNRGSQLAIDQGATASGGVGGCDPFQRVPSLSRVSAPS
jgi:hypothetical protein